MAEQRTAGAHRGTSSEPAKQRVNMSKLEFLTVQTPAWSATPSQRQLAELLWQGLSLRACAKIYTPTRTPERLRQIAQDWTQRQLLTAPAPPREMAVRCEGEPWQHLLTRVWLEGAGYYCWSDGQEIRGLRVSPRDVTALTQALADVRLPVSDARPIDAHPHAYEQIRQGTLTMPLLRPRANSEQRLKQKQRAVDRCADGLQTLERLGPQLRQDTWRQAAAHLSEVALDGELSLQQGELVHTQYRALGAVVRLARTRTDLVRTAEWLSEARKVDQEASESRLRQQIGLCPWLNIHTDGGVSWRQEQGVIALPEALRALIKELGRPVGQHEAKRELPRLGCVEHGGLSRIRLESLDEHDPHATSSFQGLVNLGAATYWDRNQRPSQEIQCLGERLWRLSTKTIVLSDSWLARHELTLEDAWGAALMHPYLRTGHSGETFWTERILRARARPLGLRQ